MLNELENKIRKAIPELNKWEYGRGIIQLPIQLNHVLEYVKETLKSKCISLSLIHDNFVLIMSKWNLKSNLLSDQSIELIKFVNELKTD